MLGRKSNGLQRSPQAVESCNLSCLDTSLLLHKIKTLAQCGKETGA